MSQSRTAVILSLGMLLERVDPQGFIAKMTAKAKEQNPNFKPQLLMEGMTLAEQFNLGKKTPEEFATELRQKLGIHTMTDDEFWKEWNEIITVGNIAKKYPLLRNAIDAGNSIIIYSDTNPKHAEKIEKACISQGITFTRINRPKTTNEMYYVSSFESGATRFELIQKLIKQYREKNPDTTFKLIHGDPANVKDPMMRAKAEAEYSAIAAGCQNENIAVVLHQNDLQASLAKATGVSLVEENNILNFIANRNATPEQKAFCDKINKLKLVREGAGILVYDNEHFVATVNPFDNTYIGDYEHSELFGVKRFLTQGANPPAESKAIKFSRDLAFPITTPLNEEIPFEVVDLPQFMDVNRREQDKRLDELAELFNRCADFTPGKQQEYLSGGKKQDKFCRFNTDDAKYHQDCLRKQIFLLDKDNKIVGTISAVILKKSGDIYFYDEVVDYFTRMTQAEKLRVQELADILRSLEEKQNLLKKQNKNDVLLDAQINGVKQQLKSLIEPHRSVLMADLFNAARTEIRKTLQENNLDPAKMRAFIRAAAGREEMYVKLGCAKENKDVFVIHGPRTECLDMLDLHTKRWANKKLQQLKVPTSSNAKWALFGGMLTLFGASVVVKQSADFAASVPGKTLRH